MPNSKALSLLQKTNSQVRKTGLKDLKSNQMAVFIEQYMPSIKRSIVKHITPERMVQMVTNLMSKNPKLKECTPQSLVSAVMQASELGFKPVQALGECYFVPYGKEIQFQIGYKGYISLARRSGEIKTLHAYCVFPGDEFEYELGLHPVLHHKPAFQDNDPQSMTHVYAVAHYKDGGYNFVVLNKSQVERLRVRNYSQKNRINGAWASDYDKMAMAKAIKQLAKFMPLSDEMQKAVQVDESVPQFNQFTEEGNDNLQYPTEEVPHEDVTND